MTNQTIARLRPSSLRSAAQSCVAQTYRPDPVRLGRVALRRNRRRTTMQLGNGTTRAYAYDANSRLTTQIELNGATRLVTIVDSYDPVGNRIGRNLDGVVTTWTYDDLYRLTHQDKTGQVCTYVLDPVGNLEVMWEASANPKTFTFDAADRLVTMVEGSQMTTYTYTAFGALETEVTTGIRVTNTYDGMDQLVKVHRTVLITPFISTYTFDGDGLRRTAQEGNVQPTTMIWDGSDYLFLDGPSSDQLVLTLGGEVVASGSRDLLTDPLGSLVREITAGATLSGQFDLYPYGRLVAGSPTPATPYVFVAAAGYYRDGSERIFGFGSELSVVNGRFFQSGNVGGRNDNPWGIPPLPTVGDLLQPPLVGPPGGWPKCGEVRLISSEGTVTNTERTCGTIEVTITKIGGGKIGFTLPPPFNLVIEVGGDVSVGKAWTCHCHVLLHTKKTRTKRCVFECSTPLPNQCGSPEIPIGKWKCEWLPDKISRSRVRRIDCPNGWWEVPYTS